MIRVKSVLTSRASNACQRICLPLAYVSKLASIIKDNLRESSTLISFVDLQVIAVQLKGNHFHPASKKWSTNRSLSVKSEHIKLVSSLLAVFAFHSFVYRQNSLIVVRKCASRCLEVLHGALKLRV